MAPPPPIKVTFSPYGVNFGDVVESTSSSVVPVVITASQNVGINITPSDTRFTASPSGNINLTANVPQTVNFQFNANTSLGSVTAQFFQFQGYTGYPPGSPELMANTVPTGSTSWGITPNPFDFGVLRQGTTSAGQVFTVKNNSGTGSVTIDSVTSAYGEFTITGLPSLPTTLGPGGSFTFTVTCEAESLGSITYSDGLVVTPSTGGAQDVSLSYEGYAIIPAYTLNGTEQDVIYGMWGLWGSGVPSAQYGILNAGELGSACEVDSTFIKHIDFQNPGGNTYINKFYIRTEGVDECELTVSDTSIISGVLSTVTKSVEFPGNSTGVLSWLQFDIEQNGEDHMFEVTLTAASGTPILDLYIVTFEERGPVYELPST